MDLRAVEAFLGERLNTKDAMAEAANVATVSLATMYRYKANPDSMSLKTLRLLSNHFALPLSHTAIWSKDDILASERRRLSLESAIAKVGGRRIQTVWPYTVNDELPELTRALLKVDYGPRATELEDEILSIRADRAALYENDAYESWEIWNQRGYSDFVAGRGRFAAIPLGIRQAQVQVFARSSRSSFRQRYFYDGFDLPAFGCFSNPGVALIRIDDIHLEVQETHLVDSFTRVFNELRERCVTKSQDEFLQLLTNPCP
jgi:hypothetical protein